jgi:hypothetical protein
VGETTAVLLKRDEWFMVSYRLKKLCMGDGVLGRHSFFVSLLSRGSLGQEIMQSQFEKGRDRRVRWILISSSCEMVNNIEKVKRLRFSLVRSRFEYIELCNSEVGIYRVV